MYAKEEERIRRATIRVAARTRDPQLRRRLLALLKNAGDYNDLTARFPEGEKVDVAKWLRDKGHPQAADEWEKNTEKYKDKFKNASRTFPGMRKTAWHQILGYVQRNPCSRLGRASSATKSVVADRLVHRWVQSAVRQWRTGEYAKAPKRKIVAAIDENRWRNFEYPALLLARELSSK